MKKHIKKLLATTIAATTLLGSTLTACAYEPEKIMQYSNRKYAITNLTLQPTPIDYETSKYPQIDLNKFFLKSGDYTPSWEDKYVLTLNYTKVPKSLYSSGNILFGAKIDEYDMDEERNTMACINLLGIDVKNTYVSTYDVGVKRTRDRFGIIRDDFNAIVRLEPSYSVFGNDLDIIKICHTYDFNIDKYVIRASFTVHDKLLMDGFEVVVDATPNVDRSVSGRRSSGTRTAKFAGEADVLTYTGANPLSDEEISSYVVADLAISDKPFSNSYFSLKYDVFLNDIKVADDITITDYVIDDNY